LARLQTLNPGGLGRLDTANPRRVTRALERCLASGRTLDELAAEFARMAGPFADFDLKLTILHRESAELEERSQRRVEEMLRCGLVDEVHRLRAAGLEENPSAAKAIGYREVLAMLDGQISLPQLAGEIVKNTRGLIKKQRTWFRTQLPAHRTISATTLETENGLFAAPDIPK
jgi:tRNA dimethylallyltransferase